MPPTFRSLRPHLLAALSLAGAATTPAQFSPYGSATIDNTTVTTAQTLAAGTGTITATGAISTTGAVTPLTISGTNTVLFNLGTIQNGGTARGVVADGTGLQLTNGSATNTGALIQAVANDAVRSSNAGTSISLTNYGTILANPGSSTANPQQAIDWNSVTTGANRVDNYGTIRANGNDAIRPGVNGVIVNYAGAALTSTNLTGNTSSDGIDAQTNSGVQVNNAGTITGGRHGITGGNTAGTGVYAMTITNQAGGTIQASNGAGVNIDGINGNEVVTILNNGTITGNGSALVGANTVQDGDAVDVDGLVNLTNNGTIRSVNALGDTSEGVTVGGGTIINNASALIEGNVAAGNTIGATGKGVNVLGIDSVNPITAMYGNTVITNAGTIRGQSNSAITVGVINTGVPVNASGFTTTINNLAGGLLEGAGATAPAVQTGPDNDTVNNAGTITALASGIAVDLGGGNNALNVTGGAAAINGNVSGGVGGTNTLTITPGAGNTFRYAGAFSNFTTVSIGNPQTGANGTTNFAGGRVVLSGASTYAGTTTVFNGATLVANTPAAAGSATGTGAVSVLSGGILAGTGNVAGGVTLAGGATLAPGDNGAGTLTLGGNLNTANGASFTYDVGNTQLRTDHLTLAGTLAFAGPGQMTFNILSNGIGTGTYDLIDFGGSSGFDVSNLQFGTVPAGFVGSFTLTGTSLLLNVAAVPEPGTTAWVGMAALLAVAVAVRRRRATE